MIFNRRHLALFTIVLPMFLSACWSDALPTLPDQAFTQLDGTEMRTSDFRGQVLVLNFWATSCTTCVKEMPQLVAMHERFKARGLDTLAVAMSYDPPAYVLEFAKSRQLPFRVAIDHTGEFAQALGPVQLTPTTFIVDKQGVIVKRYIGEPDFAALHQLLDQLLAAPA